jgi:hypothetical protein
MDEEIEPSGLLGALANHYDILLSYYGEKNTDIRNRQPCVQISVFPLTSSMTQTKVVL